MYIGAGKSGNADADRAGAAGDILFARHDIAYRDVDRLAGVVVVVSAPGNDGCLVVDDEPDAVAIGGPTRGFEHPVGRLRLLWYVIYAVADVECFVHPADGCGNGAFVGNGGFNVGFTDTGAPGQGQQQDKGHEAFHWGFLYDILIVEDREF